ncbi:conserved exported hypothetical protein [Gammaproteobacteria bacterium]
MKNKLILIFFTTALFSSMSIFAADNDVVAKKSVSNLAARTNALEDQIRILKSQIGQTQRKENKENKTNKGDVGVSDNSPFQTYSLLEMYAHGPAVVTSPSFGVRRPDDNYSDLMNKLSSMNEDLVLLGLRKKMDNHAKEEGIPIPSRPIIALSGAVEGQVIYNSNDSFTSTSKSDINLNTAEIDVIAEVGPWATAAMITKYEDKKDTASVDSVTRWNNSRILIDRGWVTFGQLNKAPVYFTIGQVYAPFGSYSSSMVTTPSTQILGRVKDRMVILGYNQFGAYAQAYTYAGETKPAKSEVIRHVGLNLGYKYECENFMMNVGAGAIGNLAESQGMQNNIFGKSPVYSSGNEQMISRVVGLSGHVKAVLYNTYTLMAEYVGTAKAFDPTDLTFNGYGAKPQALQIEGAIKFKAFDKPGFAFAGYGLTNQALALQVPKQTFFAGYSVSIIKYTLASIEYRHDVGYSLADTSGSTGFGRTVSYPTKTPTRRHNNKITAEIGVYF